MTPSDHNVAHTNDVDTVVVPPTPRRSDEAFARAVAADVEAIKAARTRWPWLALGPLAATAAAVAFTFTTPSTPSETTSPTPSTIARVAEASGADVAVDSGSDRDTDEDVDAADLDGALADASDHTLLALADPTRDDTAEITDDDFSFAGVLGSSDQELAAVEAALDTALRRL